MTKYQIITPNGVKACVVEAVCCVVAQENILLLNIANDSCPDLSQVVARVPSTWAAISLDVIVEEM